MSTLPRSHPYTRLSQFQAASPYHWGLPGSLSQFIFLLTLGEEDHQKCLEKGKVEDLLIL